ncbi:MAG: helix-turn-helix transcriptional regulator [Candidatus Pacebacteria bacterium]|nr:helix-turn-helix transcriptional regulator [Candidatus Paceibacterota bacterium]MDD5222461.1 helix-turn-helix transcriptional regulator [bacterium]
MNKDIYLKFGRRLKSLRKETGLSQRELAQRANLSTNYLALLETGNRSPSFKTITVLAKVLQVPISVLMDLEVQEKVEKKKGRKTLDYRERMMRFLFAKSDAKVKLAYEVLRKILQE